MSDNVQGWRIQASWDEMRPNAGGAPSMYSFGSGAHVVQGLRDWAMKDAQSVIGRIIANNPTACNIQVHGQRQDLRIDAYTGDIAGSEFQGESFTLEDRMGFTDYEATVNPAAIRAAIGNVGDER